MELQGAVCSLTAATRKLLGLPDDYPLQPSPPCSFNGKRSMRFMRRCMTVGNEACVRRQQTLDKELNLARKRLKEVLHG